MYDLYTAPMETLGGGVPVSGCSAKPRAASSNSALAPGLACRLPLTRRLLGPELNRPAERNAETAGLDLTAVRRCGLWREIIATPQHA
jgi:hypothetical protein